MARRTIPAFDVLWERHTTTYIEVFLAALAQLVSNDSTEADEDAISEALCPMLTKVCFQMNQSSRCEVRVPAWERPLQPVVENELRGGQLGKRPDFTCSCINSFAEKGEDFEIPFHVECKRLGKYRKASWNLNRNYVVNGMMRFDSISHGYGKRAGSGLMVGYVIDLCPVSVAASVNQHKQKHLSSWPDIILADRDANIHQASQTVTRVHQSPTNFTLVHLWVDLRRNGSPSTSAA